MMKAEEIAAVFKDGGIDEFRGLAREIVSVTENDTFEYDPESNVLVYGIAPEYMSPYAGSFSDASAREDGYTRDYIEAAETRLLSCLIAFISLETRLRIECKTIQKNSSSSYIRPVSVPPADIMAVYDMLVTLDRQTETDEFGEHPVGLNMMHRRLHGNEFIDGTPSYIDFAMAVHQFNFIEFRQSDYWYPVAEFTRFESMFPTARSEKNAISCRVLESLCRRVRSYIAAFGTPGTDFDDEADGVSAPAEDKEG